MCLVCGPLGGRRRCAEHITTDTVLDLLFVAFLLYTQVAVQPFLPFPRSRHLTRSLIGLAGWFGALMDFSDRWTDFRVLGNHCCKVLVGLDGWEITIERVKWILVLGSCHVCARRIYHADDKFYRYLGSGYYTVWTLGIHDDFYAW